MREDILSSTIWCQGSAARQRPPRRPGLRTGARRIRRQGPPPAAAHRRHCADGLRRHPGRHRPGERFSLDRARHRRQLRRWGMRWSIAHLAVHPSVVFSAAMPRSGRRTSSGGRPWHQAAFPSTCSAAARSPRRPPPASPWRRRRWASTVELRQRRSIDLRYKVPHRDKAAALTDIKPRWNWVSIPCWPSRKRSAAELRRPDRVRAETLHRVRCLRDICPVDCITFTENGDEADLRGRLNARRTTLARTSTSRRLKTGRIMAKDEDVCLHCGLCAERCPPGRGHAAFPVRSGVRRAATTAAGRSHEQAASGQRLRGEIRQRQRIGLGQCQHAVCPGDHPHGGAGDAAQHLPQQIQGLPTWYEVRVSAAGHLARAAAPT